MLTELQEHWRHLHYGLALIVSLVLLGLALIAWGSSTHVLALSASAAQLPPMITTLNHPARDIETFLQTQPIDEFDPVAEHQRVPDKALRILALREAGSEDEQPAVSLAEKSLLTEFAHRQGLEPVWVLVDEPHELALALLAGRGEIIAGSERSLSAGYASDIDFTLPWMVSRQALVMRNDAEGVESLHQLDGRQVAIRRDSPALGMLLELTLDYPGLAVDVVSADVDPVALMGKVAIGKHDLAVVDGQFLDGFLPRRLELRTAFELPGGESRTWATRVQDEELRAKLNKFISQDALHRSVADVRFDDLSRINEHRVLRVITYRSPSNYYLDDQGEMRGFEYELIREFAQSQGLRVDMVVAPSQQEMVRWLLEGRGDLIAASMPATGLRTDPRLSVSRPYNYSSPVVVGRDKETPLVDVQDLAGRRIVLPAGSPYLHILERLRPDDHGLDIVEAETHIGIEQILSRVAGGAYDLTVVDSHKTKILLGTKEGLQAHFAIEEPLPHVWVMRTSDLELKEAVNDYLETMYRGHNYNTLYARYFERPRRFTTLLDNPHELLAVGGKLSPYDETIREHAELHGFDWRLIVALIYQESRFDPAALSSAGAIGLMQIMPATAEEIGLSDMTNPHSSIQAGMRYLHTLFERFEDDLAYADRTWFSLAAYNAGFGRVQQARVQAERMGLSPDRWFGHVEAAMLTLADSTTCRCGQPVAYVREIRSRYHDYVSLTQATQYAVNDPRLLDHDI